MSLQERTLVVKNFDPEKTTSKLLKELCIQGGPVRNVVIKPDHAFVEYEDVDSVGYTKALLDGIELFGRKLVMEPKLKTVPYFKFTNLLNDYIRWDRQNQLILQQRQHQHQLQLQQQQGLLYGRQDSMQQSQFIQPQQAGFIPVNPVQMPDPDIFTEPNSVGFDPTYSGSTPSSSETRLDNGLYRSRSFNNSHRPIHRGRRSNDRNRRR